MGLGVLEDRVLEHVPGTTRYFDDPNQPQIAHDGRQTTHLKCDTSGPDPIILVPQPSDDPNDPLNWPLWKRDLITFILSMTAIFATALGPVLAAETIQISTGLSTTFTNTALLTGYFLLGCGVAAFFFVPSGRIWGKRHLFILGTLILIGSSIWGGVSARQGSLISLTPGETGPAKSQKASYYKSIIGARAIQGVGCAPFESLINAAVGDLYFVHQRGVRMAFTNLAVFGGAFFTPILAGKISETLGWWWNFWFIAIFCAVCLVLIVLFVPETAYRREAGLNLDLAAAGGAEDGGREKVGNGGQEIEREEHSGDSETMVDASGARDTSRDSSGPSSHLKDQVPDVPPPPYEQNVSQPSPPPPAEAQEPRTQPQPQRPQQQQEFPKKVSWVQSMALFNGRKTDDTFWKLLLRPLVLFVQPAFLWACLIQGTLIGWTVFIGAILGAMFLGPPLWWDAEKTGYAYTGAFVGAIVGFLISGILSDWSAKKMTRMNKGVYEPEFRIVMVLPQLVLGAIGLYGIGYACEMLFKGDTPVEVPIMFFGFEVAGMVVGAVASSLYIVDAYRDLSIEAFTCMIIFKNIFSFALTWKAFDWVVQADTVVPLFNGVGSVHIAVCLLSVPMYVFGKRIRSFWHRHDLLKATGLK
ncbi:major facilitator superfamily transporter [Zalerion maritima]|uniref:Major facilitator superfamily transporter n=1 Tax=Zalerion maritima TaxID=339359 RepID=A0AAD5WSJ3_9PEZI|nr:major facilitator superfamily transporter [Zalerion maritima]